MIACNVFNDYSILEKTESETDLTGKEGNPSLYYSYSLSTYASNFSERSLNRMTSYLIM